MRFLVARGRKTIIAVAWVAIGLLSGCYKNEMDSANGTNLDLQPQPTIDPQTTLEETVKRGMPTYCTFFSPDACARIKQVVEAKIRPSYCQLEGQRICYVNCQHGYSQPENELLPEQKRICEVMPPPKTAEALKAEADVEKHTAIRLAAQKRRMQDAVAMVRESWERYGRVIEAIMIGAKCDIVDKFSANVAVSKVQEQMYREQMSASDSIADLVSDPTLNLQEYTTVHVQAAKEAVQNGVCERMTPASRGRLRSMVSVLM